MNAACGCRRPAVFEQQGKHAVIYLCAGHVELIGREKRGERFSIAEQHHIAAHPSEDWAKWDWRSQ